MLLAICMAYTKFTFHVMQKQDVEVPWNTTPILPMLVTQLEITCAQQIACVIQMESIPIIYLYQETQEVQPRKSKIAQHGVVNSIILEMFWLSSKIHTSALDFAQLRTTLDSRTSQSYQSKLLATLTWTSMSPGLLEISEAHSTAPHSYYS